MSHPNMFIMGPAKCGSTSLYHYFKQHNDIYMSPVKEPRFFIGENYQKGLSWYSNKYFKSSGEQKIVGEATPYATRGYSLKRIKAQFPDAKQIYCLRNPINRAYSDWCMGREKGTEKLSFEKALEENAKQRKKYTFIEEEMEAIGIANQKKAGKTNKSEVRTYIDGSFYGETLTLAYELFHSNQIKIIWFEDLSYNTTQTLEELFIFLGIDHSQKINNQTNFNPHKKSYLKYLYNIIGRDRIQKIASPLSNDFKKVLKKPFYKKKGKPQLEQSDRDFAYQFFKQDILKLEKLLGQNLDKWKVE